MDPNGLSSDKLFNNQWHHSNYALVGCGVLPPFGLVQARRGRAEPAGWALRSCPSDWGSRRDEAAEALRVGFDCNGIACPTAGAPPIGPGQKQDNWGSRSRAETRQLGLILHPGANLGMQRNPAEMALTWRRNQLRRHEKPSLLAQGCWPDWVIADTTGLLYCVRRSRSPARTSHQFFHWSASFAEP